MSRNDVFTTLGATTSSITLAALGLGAYALIYSALFVSLIDLALQFSYVRPVRPGWSRESAQRLFGFGSWASAAGILSTLLQNVDYLVLGARLPSRLVGIYYRAFAFGVQYQGKFSSVLVRMVFPLMARSEDIDEMRRVRERLAEFNALTALPLLGAFVILAPTLIPIMYGRRWDAAILPTQILTIAGMATALNAGSTGPALALGKTRLLALMTGAMVIFYAVMIYSAAPFGLTVVCLFAAAAHTIMMLACQRYLIDKVIDLPINQVLKDTAPAAVATGLAMLLGAVANHVLGPLEPRLITVVVVGLLMAVTYLGALRLLFPARSRRLRNIIRRVFARRADAPST